MEKKKIVILITPETKAGIGEWVRKLLDTGEYSGVGVEFADSGKVRLPASPNEVALPIEFLQNELQKYSNSLDNFTQEKLLDSVKTIIDPVQAASDPEITLFSELDAATHDAQTFATSLMEGWSEKFLKKHDFNDSVANIMRSLARASSGHTFSDKAYSNLVTASAIILSTMARMRSGDMALRYYEDNATTFKHE